MDYCKIDWTNPNQKISKYFSVGEAIYLGQWKRHANEADGLNDAVKKNLVATAAMLDKVRDMVAKPMTIKSWFRPKAYNVLIGGASFSQHMLGNAVDFWADMDGDGDKDGVDCDKLKALLMPILAQLGVRMEDNGNGSTWIHLDTRAVVGNGNRFFKP